LALDKNYLFNVLLGLFITLTVISLASLNEVRLDVYLSLFTLEYFVLLATLRPRRRSRDYLAIALFLLFCYLVAMRVIKVLMG